MEIINYFTASCLTDLNKLILEFQLIFSLAQECCFSKGA